jgi:succinate dehydrogenase / fumarate reductase, cytochrome b subunit
MPRLAYNTPERLAHFSCYNRAIAASAGARYKPQHWRASRRTIGKRTASSMAETTRTVERPLSPHLSVYRVMINTVMSIVHRITGAALYFGTLLLAAWLVAAAMGERQFTMVNDLFGHPIGKLILFGYTWAIFHHMLGGLRHFVWDTGRGFQIWQVNLLSWLTIIGSISLTLAAWAMGLTLRGGL